MLDVKGIGYVTSTTTHVCADQTFDSPAEFNITKKSHLTQHKSNCSMDRTASSQDRQTPWTKHIGPPERDETKWIYCHGRQIR